MLVRKQQLELDMEQQPGSKPCLFNFYEGYIMRNAGLEEAQAGIKIAGRNIDNLRYADGNSVRLYFLVAPESLQMVTAAMKLKDPYSLEKNYDPPR